MQEPILSMMLAILTLLSVATMTVFFLKKSKIPYTVVLLIMGILIGWISKNVSALHFLQEFYLSPDLVFYVFLPTLIFESAFHMNVKQFIQNLYSITLLSTIGLLVSAMIIGYLTHLFIGIPWSVSFLFGVIISATDPISVLALFKQMGAPKRLSIIVEGESLFNDGTALVLFGILLKFIQTGSKNLGGNELIESVGSFFSIIFGGLLIGIIFGFLFSKALDYVRDSKEIEITLTLLLAHFTFIIAEYTFGVSGIIATVAAGIMIGNYGAHKISPSVKEIVTHFWDYAAFLANSLIFLMVGLVIYNTKDAIGPLIPSIGLIIVFTIIARAVMVYSLIPLLNLVRKRHRIPSQWIHIIQWSGIRGALAIALVLTLPLDFAFYQEILIFTVSVVLFSTIFNGLTIGPLLKLLGLQSFSALEKFQYDEIRMLINQKVENKLKAMKDKGFVSNKAYQEVMSYYELSDRFYYQQIMNLLKEHKNHLSPNKITKVLKQHLLGIEKQTFIKLYVQEEITQEILIILLNNIAQQLENIDLNEKTTFGRTMLIEPNDRLALWLKKRGFLGYYQRIQTRYSMLRYETFRARLIATENVLNTIKDIRNCKLYFDPAVIRKLEEKYNKWRTNAKIKLLEIELKDPEACHQIQVFLAKKAAFHVESKHLSAFHKTEITNSKVYNELKSDLESRASHLLKLIDK